MKQPVILEDPYDFSLVLGGPMYQLFRRAHLTGDTLELLRRRIVIIASVAWVPLLVLSAFSGNAMGNNVAIPFLHDIEAHVRFLIALPILIAAELVVHRRIRPAVRQFVDRGIVGPKEMAGFQAAIESTVRLRNSVLAEVVLVILVYTLGLWVWRNEFALGAASWYASPGATYSQLTPAGYWYLLVSVPLFQFVLLRWYLRFFLWFWFLLRVSKLNLRLIPTHPDRTAGLGFLGASTHAFAPILVAQGAVLAGLIASQILYAGQNLTEFKVQIVGFVGVFVIAMLIPLTVFGPRLAQAKREGRRDYGKLASLYVRDFEEKWIRDRAATNDALLGSGDIQSLADLGNSYAIVQEMRLLPFGLKDVSRLVVIAAVPLLPLTLTTFSLEDLADYVIKILF